MFGPKWPKSGLKLGFLPFSHFWLLVFLEIAYIDSLQQCITSGRGKTHKKTFLGPNLGQNGSKSSPKLGFLAFSQVQFISFPLSCIG